jgi:hypothetical protein
VKKLLLTATVALAIVSVIASTAQARTARWVPGSSYFVTEDEANSFLEGAWDHAYCTGVPRFGHRGSFPYEEFRSFDCDVYAYKVSCSNNRYRAVKGSRPGYYRLRRVRTGYCF